MPDDEAGYNGWKNYETWVTVVWLDNDQVTYYVVLGIVDEAIAGEPEYPKVMAADALKEWFKEQAPDLEASVWADLLNAAISEIDWLGIAQHTIQELPDQD